MLVKASGSIILDSPVHLQNALFSIQTKLSEDNKFEVKAGMYLIKDNNTLKEVEEETLNIITNGKVISDIDFNGNLPDDNSMVILTEKGKIKEAVFYKDGYQIKYDIIKTEVTKIEKQRDTNEFVKEKSY